MTDPSLAQAVHEGRPEALDGLLAAYGREIQAVAYLILHDHGSAEDVLADTLLTAIAKGRSLRDPDALRPWLLRIATNHALRIHRRGVRLIPLDAMPDRPSLDPAVESRLILIAGVRDLPPKMRAAIVLRYFADLSVDEVATALGRSPNTIKAQLQVALDKLRLGITDQEARIEDPPAGGITAREIRRG